MSPPQLGQTRLIFPKTQVSVQEENGLMQMERQIFVFSALMGAALAYPEVRGLMTHPEAVPGGALMTGGFFGALATFFGTLMALEYDPWWFKVLAVGFWGLLALAFAGAMQYGALRSPGPVRLAFFEFFSALCLAAFFGTLYGVSRAERKARKA
jgi:hypothetical protein